MSRQTKYPFATRPGKYRKKIREMISSNGGQIRAYNDDGGFTVQMPRGENSNEIFAELARNGWHLAGYRFSDCLWPIGTDRPPENHRHNGPYQRPSEAGSYVRFCSFIGG